MRAIIAGEVHHKVLRLSPAARARFSSGRAFNLVASDAGVVNDLCQGVFGFMSAPLRIVVAMVLLYQQLGPASIVAMACVAATVPMNSALVRRSAAALRRSLAFTDERTKLESELVAGEFFCV